MTDLPAGIERLDDSLADQRRLQDVLQGAIPIRYADAAGAWAKRGSPRGALVLLDLKGHLDVTMALTALKSVEGSARYDYDLMLSGSDHRAAVLPGGNR